VTRADKSQQLWLEYRRTGDEKLRDGLILTYEPLVNYVAGRLCSGDAVDRAA
jgi:DNA-directed RNA polymerase specialized sigma subunit